MANFTLYWSIYTSHTTEYEAAGGASKIHIDRINYWSKHQVYRIVHLIPFIKIESERSHKITQNIFLYFIWNENIITFLSND